MDKKKSGKSDAEKCIELDSKMHDD